MILSTSPARNVFSSSQGKIAGNKRSLVSRVATDAHPHQSATAILPFLKMGMPTKINGAVTGFTYPTDTRSVGVPKKAPRTSRNS